jgi:putative ABC transport system permease protein
VKTSERIYRWFLHLYPRDFRDEYGLEMSMVFRARAEQGPMRLWIQVIGDLLSHAPREHWSIAKQDARYAFRTWLRTPAIPAIAVTALTLGMGANVAIFSVIHGVLLRPLPVPEPERLMLLRGTNAARGLETSAVSLPDYLSWKAQARSLELTALSGQSLTWNGAEYAERLEALAPTESFLAVVGVPLHMGRWFTAEEGRLGRHRVAVLSNGLWRTRFGADPGVLGRQIVLNGTSYSIIGVASAGLSIPSEADLWVPQVVDQTTGRRGNRYLTVIGRLKHGFTHDQAQAEMTAIAAGLAHDFPDSNKGFGVRMVAIGDSIVSEEIRTALTVLFAAALMVLLIACANVASVLLSRALARRREIAIRAALGAGAARIARQLLTESILLSLTGAVLGVLLATAIVNTARHLLVNLVPRIESVSMTLPVFGFALGLAVVTGVAFGLAPLWQVSRARSLGLLHATGWGDRLPTRNRMRTLLVIGQVSLTTLLLVGAALLIQSLVRLQRVPVGFNADSVVTAKLALARARLPNGAAIHDFLSRLTDDLQSAPGITSAGFSSAIPLSPGAYTIMQAAAETDRFVTCEWRLVDSGYFRTLGIPLLRGRLFGPQDGPKSPRVFVIGHQTARALYGDDNPIGRRLRLENGTSGEIVGIVGDVRMRNLDQPPERVVYFPPSQFGFFPLFNIVIREDGPPGRAAAVIRDRLKAQDPNLAAYEIQEMRHWVDQSSFLMRVRTRLLTLLGAIALLLGVIGIYGVMSSLVAQRTREFGIRVALGARPWALPLSVVAQGLRFTLAGIVLGLVAAIVVGDRIGSLLFEVHPHDPATFAGVAVVVVLVAVAASYVPARRAATTDPLVVLRVE